MLHEGRPADVATLQVVSQGTTFMAGQIERETQLREKDLVALRADAALFRAGLGYCAT
jgi:hypothetical protein